MNILLSFTRRLCAIVLPVLAATASFAYSAAPSQEEAPGEGELLSAHVFSQGAEIAGLGEPVKGLISLKGAALLATTSINGDTDRLPMEPTIGFGPDPDRDIQIGSRITTQYAQDGIIFGPPDTKIIKDGNSATSPVLSGVPDFDGDITGRFVDKDSGEPAPVYALVFSIGGFETIGAVLMEFFAPDGQLMFSGLNDTLDFQRQLAFGGTEGIGSFRFSNVSQVNPDGFGIDNISFSTPGELNLGEELGLVACSLGNPVNPATGNKYQIEVDYEQAKPFPLKVERSYNSMTGDWQFFMQIENVLGSNHARVIRPDGKRLTFTRLLDSYWASINPANSNTLSLNRDENGQIIGWLYKTLDDMAYQFNELGKLSSVTDRTGITHSYMYNLDNIVVTHSMGGSVTYHLDTTGKIVGFTDPDGYDFRYDYDVNGMLSVVTFPAELGSPQKIYRYEDANSPSLLTSIWYNDTENTYLYGSWSYDGAGRAIRSSHDLGNDSVDFDYTFLNDPEQPRVTATNSLGKSTTYYFADLNGRRVTWAVDGHESDNCLAANQVYGYYLNGQLYSKRDWNGVTTSYQRNEKGQETSRTEAVGTPEERTITTSWHGNFNLPLKIVEPGRRTRFTYDGNGNLKSKTIEDTTTP